MSPMFKAFLQTKQLSVVEKVVKTACIKVRLKGVFIIVVLNSTSAFQTCCILNNEPHNVGRFVAQRDTYYVHFVLNSILFAGVMPN